MVQSSDSYSSISDKARMNFLEEQFLDLLQAQAPDERSPSSDSLEGAIRMHDLQFNDH
jgi:hypothetical protein